MRTTVVGRGTLDVNRNHLSLSFLLQSYAFDKTCIIGLSFKFVLVYIQCAVFPSLTEQPGITLFLKEDEMPSN